MGCPGGGGVQLLDHPPSSGALIMVHPDSHTLQVSMLCSHTTQRVHDVVDHEKKHPSRLSSESLIVDSFVGHALSLAIGILGQLITIPHCSDVRQPMDVQGGLWLNPRMARGRPLRLCSHFWLCLSESSFPLLKRKKMPTAHV